jgi:salivary lysozyme
MCEIDCNKFLNEDISDDVSCARTIYSIHGFDAWTGWRSKCKGQDNSYYISDCDLKTETSVSLIERLLQNTKDAIQSFLTTHKDDPNQSFIVRTLNKMSFAMRVILNKLKYF